MKQLYLMRHGQAETKGVRPDIERNLEKTGQQEVVASAREMIKRKITPSLILSSKANRALQTAELVAKEMGYNSDDIRLEPDIYYTDADTLLEILHNQDDEFDSILLAGHNPSLSYLADMLTDTYNSTIPTGGVVGFESEADSWKKFEKETVKNVFKIYP